MMTRKPRWANTWGPRGERVRTSEGYWRKPLAWNRQAEAEGVRYRVFPSLCDPFDEHKSIKHEWALDFYELIQDTPHLDWLLLTKRPKNVIYSYPHGWHLLPNMWLGTSVENQETADQRIPDLLNIPARVRFLSCEPLLGPIDLQPWLHTIGSPVPVQIGARELPGSFMPFHWVIVGGESGSSARPMDLDWARHIVSQCHSHSVPVFVKQLGAKPVTKSGILPGHVTLPIQHSKGGDMSEWPGDLQIREFPAATEPAHA